MNESPCPSIMADFCKTMKAFTEDEIYFVSIIANLILTAVKLRKKIASEKNTAAMPA